MLATVHSAVVDGVDGIPVRVEVDVRDGLPTYTVVGMPDAVCRESRDRVRAAIQNSGARWPSRRVTVNLAPGNVRKQGASLDLAIAIAVLAADDQIPPSAIADLGMAGELGLDGSVRPAQGMIIIAASARGREFFAPAANRSEVALVRPGEIRIVATLRQLVEALTGDGIVPPLAEPSDSVDDRVGEADADFADVRGQAFARYAVEVAAAGGHHILMVGSPGAGKTMLATRLRGLLPDLQDDEALLATRIHSAAGLLRPGAGLVRVPPLRAPHHSASTTALIGGGGSSCVPGEVSVADCGVLFLDELGEFSPQVLDALRQPLEEGLIRISRVGGSRILPARFQLVAATNPCPCGFGTTQSACTCRPAAVARYLRRLSGPLLDRFDLRIQVAPPDPHLLLDETSGEESTRAVADRVAAVRRKARARGFPCNARLPGELIEDFAPLTGSGRSALLALLEAGAITGRGATRLRLIARTITDLSDGGIELDADAIDAAAALRRLPVHMDMAVAS